MTDRPLAGLRVAQLIETGGPGGAERVFVHLSRSLELLGARVTAFIPRREVSWLRDELAAAGVDTVEFTLDKPISPAFARWLGAELTSRGIHLAHGHEFTFAFYAWWAARRARIEHLATIHGGRYWAGALRRRVALRLAAGGGARLVAVSVPLRQALARDLVLRAARVNYIPNGVPVGPSGSPVLRTELRLQPDDRLLLAVGNLYPVKGHAHLLEAVRRLQDPRIHVAIAGRGALHDALADQARESGMGDRLHLLGLRRDVPDLLASADVYVMPSLSEGLPMALLEAMAAGLPVVASAVGDIPSVLAGGTAGVLTVPGDAESIAGALRTLLPDEPRRGALGAAGRARVMNEYTLSTMTDRYVALYRRVLGGSLPSLPLPDDAVQITQHDR